MISISCHRIAPALLILGIAQASAVTIAQYNFNAGNLTSSDTEINSTVSDISSGAGITDGTDLSTNQGVGNTPGIQINYDDIYPQNSGDKTLAEAITDSVYYSITITPASGQTINFDGFTAYTDKNGGGAIFEYHIFSSVDGFAVANSIESSGHGSGVANLDYDISSLSGITSATEFRLYIRTNSYSSGGNILDLDNVIITGTVIPEPSALALLGLSGLALLVRRRK